MKKSKGIITILAAIVIMIVGAILLFSPAKKNSVLSNNVKIRKDIKLNNEIPKSVYDSKKLYIKILLKEDSNPKIKTILANLNLYPESLVKLASYNKAALDFVYDYPFEAEYYQNKKIDIKSYYEKGKIPLFLQWDKQWGYDKYGDNYIAVNGCGPTALSMVIVGLTGDTSINPKVVADYSESKGEYVNGEGSKWTMMTDIPEHFGVEGKEIPLIKSKIIDELKEGNPIIAAMGPGVFTKTGHFIVLTGITEDGQVIVNDPDSKVNSEKTWNLNLIMKETKDLWAFKKM
ncbi:C39 family peptidase [Clostridium thermobutyricum]|uniref:C39 family peptidase n=1 Tax=Clostridium thermobutyricum TaxID=29372 RepID=UPI0018A928BD|nr:C39 family peptidase [Clostridium thermobutyricum]